jgi:hypothetical protein
MRKATYLTLLLIAAGPRLDMQGVDWCETVEVNTFGAQPRTAILYRDAGNSIVDWRWYSRPDQIPRPLGDGRCLAVWNDQGKLRRVYCRHVRYTRTKQDVELAERAKLGDEKRRKLSR